MCPSSPSPGRIPPSLSCASASASLPSSRRTPSLPPPQKKRPILPCYARSPSPAPLAPFFSLTLPLAHSTKKKTNPLAWVHVLMHSTGPVHHQSSLLPFLSLSQDNAVAGRFLVVWFSSLPTSMDKSHCEIRPTTLFTTIWSPEHGNPSSLLLYMFLVSAREDDE